MTGIVAAGELAWSVVTDNRPTSAVSSSFAAAIPAGANWQDLSAPIGTNTFRWTFKNGWLMPDFTYDLSLHWTYGARWRNGGAFITRCWMEVDDHSVGIGGINVNINCSTSAPDNVGTEKAPVARLYVVIQMAYTTWLWGGGGKVTAELHGTGAGSFSDHYEDEGDFRFPVSFPPPLQPA